MANIVHILVYILFDSFLLGLYLLPICRITFYWKGYEEKRKIFSPILAIILMILQKKLNTKFEGFTLDFFRRNRNNL